MAPSRKRPGRTGADKVRSAEPLTWLPGSNIDYLVSNGRLEWVTPDPEFSKSLLEKAKRHIFSAALIAETDDSDLAISNAYDAARKALTAIIADQGLRPTLRGGHTVILELLRPQFPDSREVFLGFDWLRIKRHGAEYPDPTQTPVSEADLQDALNIAKDVVSLAERYLDQYGESE